MIFPLFWRQRMGNKSHSQLFSPKSSVIILRMVSLSMWNCSGNNLIIEHRSSAKAAHTFAMCSSVQLVRGHPTLGSSSTFFGLLWNLLYYLKMFIWDRHSLPYTFCNILNVSVAVNSFLKQNLIAVRCSQYVSMTTDEKNAYENNYYLHDTWSYNIEILYPR